MDILVMMNIHGKKLFKPIRSPPLKKGGVLGGRI
jgi:hypothetical protein